VLKSLTFGMDFDDTFTADPVLMSEFVLNAQKRGHKVLCVTSRRDCEESREEMEAVFSHFGVMIPIIFCNMGSKLWTMEQRGTTVDIWVDDAPHAIVHGR